MSVKILFRCDAANIKEIGSGHLIRCITIAKLLIKNYKVKKKEILFLIKTEKKYSLGEKILKRENLNYKKINEKIRNYSLNEYEEIINNKFKIIIFDRLGNIRNNFIQKLKKIKKKIICFDDSSKNKFNTDLSCNPLVFNKYYNSKNHYAGNEYNIIPSKLYSIKTKEIKKIQNIFLSFGGYDYKNLKKKLIFLLKQNKNFKKVNFINTEKKKFEKKSNFFKKMAKCELVVCSGGLTMFDAIFLNKIIIVTSQFQHQIKNILRLQKMGLVIFLKNINKKELNNALIHLNNPEKLKNLNNKIKKYNRLNKMNIIMKKIYSLYAN